MKLSIFATGAKSIKYPGILLRFPLALFIGNYLVVYGEPETFLEFLTIPNYYYALFASVTITLIVSEIIYQATKSLDVYLPWLKNWYSRLLAQFCICVILPIAIVYFTIKKYFLCYGIVIDQTNYLKYDISLVVCLIVLINAYYLITYLLAVKLDQQKQRISSYYSSHDLAKDKIAIVYTDNKISMVMTFEGKKIIKTETLKEIFDALPFGEYFAINRSEVVHRDCIVGFEPSISRTLKLSLLVTARQNHEYIVSQRKVAAFKKWYKECK